MTIVSVPDDNGTRYQLHLTERAEWQHTLREKDLIDVFYAKTSNGQRYLFHTRMQIIVKQDS